MLAAGRPLMKEYNVTMEVFVQEPDGYAQEQRFLEEILNLTAYQALEAITKPLHEGVLSLSGNVGVMKEEDTITPLARGTPNGVLTQVLTEERREAEERLRRTQEMKFTISTTIEDVLFKRRVRVNEMKLNDFLTRELDGRGVVATNRDVLLEEFFKDPTKYIRDKGALNEMQASLAQPATSTWCQGLVLFAREEAKRLLSIRCPRRGRRRRTNGSEGHQMEPFTWLPAERYFHPLLNSIGAYQRYTYRLRAVCDAQRQK
ncbi:retrotransposon hot spot (RHS) protein, putative, partial [Trypanosoma cruzi]